MYTLDMPCQYSYTSPLFDTRTPPSDEAERNHNITIVPCSDGDGDTDFDSQTAQQTSGTEPSATSTSATVDEQEPGPSSTRHVEAGTSRDTFEDEMPHPTLPVDDQHVTSRRCRGKKGTSSTCNRTT